MTWRRGCLAGDVVWEVVAGVADEDGVLVLERRRARCQEMRVNVVNAKEQRTGLGEHLRWPERADYGGVWWSSGE